MDGIGPSQRTTRMFRSDRQVAAAGAKSAVSDYILLLARLHVEYEGQTSDALWRLPSSAVVCNTPHMQHNSPGAARIGGPVVLRPVRATLCFISSLI